MEFVLNYLKDVLKSHISLSSASFNTVSPINANGVAGRQQL